METAWTNQLSVGNAMIDSEHQNLIVMIDRIESMIRAKDAASLPQELEQFERYLCVHFINEEKLAQAVSFPFEKNKQEHQFVLKEFQRMKDELLAKKGAWTDDAAKHYFQFHERMADRPHRQGGHADEAGTAQARLQVLAGSQGRRSQLCRRIHREPLSATLWHTDAITRLRACRQI